ncbi:MAG TPA: hypothetical protein VK081_03265 [Planctomycetota bacterium]|nr:hypothetical protein [Planctomycetota bacterium]
MRAATVACFALVAGGCSSPDLAELAERFAAGDYQGVRMTFDDLAVDDRTDAHLWWMNRAVADLAVHQPRAGIEALRRARDRLDELRRDTSWLAWIETAFTDDRALVYDGADYEHVLVRAYLALLDLACGEGDVIAYLNQMLLRQVELREEFVTDEGERPKLGLRSAAIGNWLLAALAADDPTKGDVVRRQLDAVLEHEPDCAIARAEQERYAREGLCRPGNGVVQIVALVGLGPYRVARDEPLSSVVLDAAQRIYNAYRGRVAVPVNLIEQVQIADLVVRHDNPSEVHVAAGPVAAVTETVTSVDRLAEAEFAVLRPQIVLRAVLRRIFKLVTAEVIKQQLIEDDDDRRKGGKKVAAPVGGESAAERRRREEEERRKRERREQLGSLAVDLLTWLWVAAEDADTRCWALLPASFQVARLELPAGVHEVVLRAGDRGRAVGEPQKVAVRVRAGRTTFVIAQVPSRRGGPVPMSSDPAAPDPGVQ